MVRLEHRFLVYVPQGDGPHPVLCFLHGAGEGARDKKGSPQLLEKLFEHQSPAWHAENGTPFGSRFLLVCPQLERYRRWEPTDASLIDAVVETAISDYKGDKSRLVLTGFSYGGEGAFQIASESTHRWSTIFAVDPALQRVPPYPAADVRVWVHHGRQQPGTHNMDSFAQGLGLQPWTGALGASRVLTNSDTDHGPTCAQAYVQADVCNWMLR